MDPAIHATGLAPFAAQCGSEGLQIGSDRVIDLQ